MNELQSNDRGAEIQLLQWHSESKLIKLLHPEFSLDAAVANPLFIRMLVAGVPLRYAYEVILIQGREGGCPG